MKEHIQKLRGFETLENTDKNKKAQLKKTLEQLKKIIANLKIMNEQERLISSWEKNDGQDRKASILQYDSLRKTAMGSKLIEKPSNLLK